MVDVSQEQRCPVCGGTRDAGPTGSITQWLRICHCNVVAAKEPDFDGSSIQICYSCGRRIGGGRQGSLTQWIFRPDFCDCERPEPRDIDEADFGIGNIAEMPLLAEDEQLEMEVDSTKWPSVRYKPLALIGHGGFGAVYRCHDRLLNKTIALKMMRHLTPRQLISFQQEARATSRVTHPNIVQVYDFGATDSGAPFMTMEYVDGISLDQVLFKHGTLNVDQAIYVFSKVCDALAHAHRANVLHRDIKSANILLIDPMSEEPTVKLIDFGVALFRTEEGTNLHVQGSTIAGSPNYMAPDQVLGKQYDERSEIYGLGSTIFEALTGRTPFDGEHTLDTLRQQASMPPPKLVDIKPEGLFPEELEDLVAKCLAKDQELRFQSMTDLKDALEAVGATTEAHDSEPESPVSTPVVPPTNENELSRSSPVVVTLFLILIFVGAVVGLVAYRKATRLTDAKTDKTVVPDIQTSVRGAADTIFEADKPRFVLSLRTGQPWLVCKGSVSDEDLIALKGRKDYENLSLGRADTTGKGLTYIDAPLKMLILAQTPFSDQYVQLLKKHEKLESLDLNYTKISDRGVADLLRLPSLMNLHIGGSPITDKGVICVSQIKQLRSLHLVDLPDVTSVGLATLAKAPHLDSLALTKLNIGSEDFGWMKKLTHLKDLVMNQVGLNDRGLEQLSTLHLSTIDLKNNREITNNGLKKLARIKELRTLIIEGSPLVTKEGLTALNRLNPRLQIDHVVTKKRRESFEGPTGDVLKDMLDINATDRELWHQNHNLKKDVKRK